MAEVNAELVRTLRERTGLGMMECKKALVETNGDINAAEQALRIKSGAKASKMAGRVAAEGVIGIWVSPDNKKAAMVELNCETDFVAKNTEFSSFAEKLAQIVAGSNPANVEALSQLNIDGVSAEKARQDLIMKLGENMSIRRFSVINAKGQIATYRHGVKIGVIIDGEGGYSGLGKDLAMHIAASKPICVDESGVPAETLEREKVIYKARAEESGKPANIVEKMIEGSLKKFLADVTLIGQPFVKNPEQTVGQLLKSEKATAYSFTMFIVGEGIEKKSSDFAAEVAATVAASK